MELKRISLLACCCATEFLIEPYGIDLVDLPRPHGGKLFLIDLIELKY